MLRLTVIFLSCCFTAFTLTCYNGTYAALDGKAYMDNKNSVKCVTGALGCIKEKIWATGQSGHTVAAIRYGCDYYQCNTTYMAQAQSCSKPQDLWIGDWCCCTSDNCNSDRSPQGSSASNLFSLLPLSFFIFFY